MTTRVRQRAPAPEPRPKPAQAEARIAELEAQVTAQTAELRQRIAELAVVNEIGAALARQLDFEAIIEVVGERVAAMFKSQDMFIALYDRVSGLITFPYELDAGRRLHGEPMAIGQGLTSEVLRSGRALRLGTLAEQVERGALLGTYVDGQVGTQGGSWLGVPILSGDEPIGVVVFSDMLEHAFTEADEQVVSTIASSMGVALANARLFEQTNVLLGETKERAAELAIINSVQESLAARLETQAMYDLVGDKIQEIFDAQVVDIGIFDAGDGLIHFPYTIERGMRFEDEPLPWIGLRKKVLDSKAPLVINRDAVGAAVESGQRGAIQGEPAKSSLFVPLFSGGEVSGVISLQNLDHEDAFSEGDVRLLSTLAASLGVALENVRLFDETKRLLAESTARAAELAIVNEIGTALVKPREMQAVLEAVGDRAAQALGARGLSICLVNPRTNELTFDYWVDEGVRVRDREGVVLGDPLSAEIVRSGRPFRVGTAEEAAARGFPFAVGNTESYLGVPIPAGDRAIGVFAVGTRERDAYSEADERVMSTLAASMGVALENARLFDETKRLLAETEQRNAELAVVNEIGAALGKQLDFEAIIDAVGDRVGQILGSGEISIAILDEKTGLISFPYWVENGVRERNLEPLPLGRGLTSHVIQTGQPLRLGTADEADQYDVHWVGVRTESYLAAPIRTGDRVFGVLSVSDERANAFGEADERLLSTLASSMGVAIENARLFDETKRLLAESNERAAELAIINSVQQGLASQLDMQAMYDLVGDKIREIFDAQVVDIGLYDLDAGIIRLCIRRRKGRTPVERRQQVRADGGTGGGDRAATPDQRRRCLDRRARRRGRRPSGRAVEVRSARPAGRRLRGPRPHLASEHRPHQRVHRV